MFHFSQKFSARVLDQIICKHFWPLWNTIVSVKILCLKKNSLGSICCFFYLQKLMFLLFLFGMMRARNKKLNANSNAPNIHFSIKVSGKQDKIFSTFFTWIINWMKVTSFHNLCQGIWDAYCHHSKGKGCCLHHVSTLMMEIKDRHKLRSSDLIPVNWNFA